MTESKSGNGINTDAGFAANSGPLTPLIVIMTEQLGILVQTRDTVGYTMALENTGFEHDENLMRIHFMLC